MTQTDQVNHRQTYVLTCDLPRKVASLKLIGLNKTLDPQDKFFSDVRSELAGLLSEAFPEAEIRVIDMEEQAFEVLSRARKLLPDVDNEAIISTCSEISAPVHSLTLEINRLVDTDGKIIGIGPRPGYPSVKQQIANMRSHVSDRPVIIVEDGAFSGATLCQTIALMQEAGINVEAVVLGFVFPGAREKLAQNFGGKVIMVEEMTQLIDWMPDHDFFPFIPNCGRVLGMRVNENCPPQPIYSHDGFSFTVPYLRPYAPMESWTSIPGKFIGKISDFCLRRTIELFKKLEEVNGDRRILVRDIRGAKPAISIPQCLGLKNGLVYHPQTPITKILRDDLVFMD